MLEREKSQVDIEFIVVALFHNAPTIGYLHVVTGMPYFEAYGGLRMTRKPPLARYLCGFRRGRKFESQRQLPQLKVEAPSAVAVFKFNEKHDFLLEGNVFLVRVGPRASSPR